jgi:hypothetical protein
VQPVPKAASRKASYQWKERRKAAILTDAPEKRTREEARQVKDENKHKKATIHRRTDV